jgi:hypothetical protein
MGQTRTCPARLIKAKRHGRDALRRQFPSALLQAHPDPRGGPGRNSSRQSRPARTSARCSSQCRGLTPSVQAAPQTIRCRSNFLPSARLPTRPHLPAAAAQAARIFPSVLLYRPLILSVKPAVFLDIWPSPMRGEKSGPMSAPQSRHIQQPLYLAEETLMGLLFMHRYRFLTIAQSPQMSHRLCLLDLIISLELSVRRLPHLSLVETFLEYRRVTGTKRRETADYVCVSPRATRRSTNGSKTGAVPAI